MQFPAVYRHTLFVTGNANNWWLSDPNPNNNNNTYNVNNDGHINDNNNVNNNGIAPGFTESVRKRP